MTDANGNKKVHKKKTLKEYFKGLKTHQKVLLVTSHLIGFAQFILCIILYFMFFVIMFEDGNIYGDIKEVFKMLTSVIMDYWYCTILPVVTILIDLIFIRLRKFSYIVCGVNVVIIFFNRLLILSYVLSKMQ